jgi:hypothetical protein
MIRIFIFECEKCGYSVRSAGGLTEGLDLSAQTIVCEECKQLQDAVIAFKVDAGSGGLKSAPAFADVMNQLSITGPTRWEHFEAACSVDPRHRIREWKQPGKCPRCGVFIEPSPIPISQWD